MCELLYSTVIVKNTNHLEPIIIRHAKVLHVTVSFKLDKVAKDGAVGARKPFTSKTNFHEMELQMRLR
jgi:hypothetical protein